MRVPFLGQIFFLSNHAIEYDDRATCIKGKYIYYNVFPDFTTEKYAYNKLRK